MIKPSRVDGSVCCTALSHPTFKALALPGTLPAIARRTLCSIRHGSRGRAAIAKEEAGTCSRSTLWLLATFSLDSSIRPCHRTRHRQLAVRPFSSTSTTRKAQTAQQPAVKHAVPPEEKSKLLSYVENAEEGSAEEHFSIYRDPYRRGYAAPDGTALQVSDRLRDVQYSSRDETFKITDKTQDLIDRICTSINQRLRHPQRTSLEPIYQLYSELPEPRMLHLTWQWRNRLLKVMGTPRRRDTESMLRYFALVADVKNAGLTLRRSQWNFALAFATKYAARVTTGEMESALRLWREMERGANVLGNDVTFNVLFDVAAKAGNFALAEMIYKEMENRGIEFNRYHRVSLIHFFGLKLDSGGIRAAYREMVLSGEMIDTVVLNCVISGLLRCGEESAAEETYQRMKAGHDLSSNLPQRNYMTDKVVTKVLMMFTKVAREHPQLHSGLQMNVNISPDLHTYKLLIEHYAVRVGNLTKVAQYLDEMKHLRISVHPTIFLALFKGFFANGGFPGSDWSEKRLNGVLSALYQAQDEHIKGFRIDRWIVIWALRAVKKCSSTEALVHAFDTISQKWDIPADRQPYMHALFENILHDKDVNLTWRSLDGVERKRKKRKNPLL